jgi:hypothetical protein
MTCVRGCRWRRRGGGRLLVAGMGSRPGLRGRLLTACRRSVLVSAGSARGAETALRIEQEYPGRHDLFTFSQALANLDAIGQLSADRHGPGLEHIADRHEHVLLQPCVDDGVARYRDDVLSG